MSDLFEAEVLTVEHLDTLTAVHKAKLLKDPKLFSKSLRLDDPAAPELPLKAKTVEELLAPLTSYLAGEHPPVRDQNSAFVVFARYLGDRSISPSPLPVVRLDLRVRETHPQAGMPKEISSSSPFLAALLGLRSASNPMRDHFGAKLIEPRVSTPGVAYSDFLTEGPPVFVGWFSGKATTIEVDGQRRKEMIVPVAIYGHWVTDVKPGMRWSTGISP